MIDYKNYRKELEDGFFDYWKAGKRSGLFKESMLDPGHGADRLPVFKAEHAANNIIANPAATEEEKRRLTRLVPERKLHKWFRSMSSSQALALSFFGNLVIYGELEWLRDLKAEDGRPAFGDAELAPYNFSMEHAIGNLNEPRPTSLDAYISGRYRVAIECKLSETGFGDCSRPRLSQESPEFCDGSYTFQGKRKNRCALSEIGVRYWEHVPALFDWPADKNYENCPLRHNYQLVRNVLAACVREDGLVSPSNGHALVVYDRRNPEFVGQGDGAETFRLTQLGLKNRKNLGRLSWQDIAAFMRQGKKLPWLMDALESKYGIKPEAS
jgi:hypothetical protein